MEAGKVKQPRPSRVSISSVVPFWDPSNMPATEREAVIKTTVWSDGCASVLTAKRMLLAAWTMVGLFPLLLQTRSFLIFATPHKISKNLVAPLGVTPETTNLSAFCPVEGLLIAHAWWNVLPTHYYPFDGETLCHFTIPQYNIHGNYMLGANRTGASSTSPENCANESFPFEHYFYHGSIGYYAFYEEAEGSFCAMDRTAYVRVGGLGTYDSNGENLAEDGGHTEYRRSYWYGVVGFIWVMYRTFLLRRSYIAYQRYGRRCDRMEARLGRRDGVVYVQESMRLSAHGARNYHRLALLYLLLEGVMTDLFMLIAQDGILTKLQYISLGYNLSGVLLMLFEIVESMNWMSEKARCLIKRLLFNYETALAGEFVVAVLLEYYLTALNRSTFRGTAPVAEVVSHYVWSLVGHGAIVLGVAVVILSVRVLGACAFVWKKHRSWVLFVEPCCVDTILGPRNKMVRLRGYCWRDGKLCYTAQTLKAFGYLHLLTPSGREFLVLRKLYWFAGLSDDFIAIGEISGPVVEACNEHRCKGLLTLFDRELGGTFLAESPFEPLAPEHADSHLNHRSAERYVDREQGVCKECDAVKKYIGFKGVTEVNEVNETEPIEERESSVVVSDNDKDSSNSSDRNNTSRGGSGYSHSGDYSESSDSDDNQDDQDDKNDDSFGQPRPHI